MLQRKNAIVTFLILVILHTSVQDLDHRLPKHIVPYYYNIIIDIDPNFLYFDGATQIYFKVLEQTNRIILHAVRLINLDVHVHFNGAELLIANKTYHNYFQFFIMDFVRPLHPGNYIIDATYRANFNQGTDGFYITEYSSLGETRFQVIN